jgi:hypothetical protein
LEATWERPLKKKKKKMKENRENAAMALQQKDEEDEDEALLPRHSSLLTIKGNIGFKVAPPPPPPLSFSLRSFSCSFVVYFRGI